MCHAVAALVLAGSFSLLHASEHHGQVAFNNLPVPGATVTVTHGAQSFSTITNDDGSYAFPDLADGVWKIDVEVPLFVPIQQSITVTPTMPGIRWDLQMLPLAQVLARAKVIAPAQLGVMAEAEPAAGLAAGPKPAARHPGNEPEAPRPAEEPPPSNDGFLVNGTVNNAATSQFTLAQGFGNTRKGTRSLYNGGLGVIYDNSALDARPYSLSGLDSPKSAYNTITGIATLGGPIRIPHVLPRGPTFFLAYQWTRNNTATDQTALVPTLAQRSTVPIDPIAQALLALYPQPNSSSTSYNYQTPVLTHAHQDALQSRLEKSIGRRDDFYGGFAFQSTRSDNTSVFGFRDQTGALGMNFNANWQHRFNAGLFATLGFNFSRLRTLITPYFQNRSDIEGSAGIVGVDSAPVNWGPPTLVFSSGIAPLTDAQSAFNRNRTDGVSPSAHYYRGRHNITLGVDFRREEFNDFAQQDPRGTFTFTGAATGSDFSDFTAGKPDTASINYGNADKYLRQSVYDAYITDDLRLRPEFTINVGVRWEYGAPITELKNRLVNLDVAPGFTAVAPVLASAPVGPLTGLRYPSSLLFADRRNVEPRIGLSWRPIPGSSLVLRGGYGVYVDTSVYESTALQLAEEPPLTTNSLNAQNSAACPLTLSTGLVRQPCTATTPNTFAVDPNFRVGYAQTWQLSAQRDLPFALQMTATYLGIKGTRGVQEFLPNTYPVGGTNPCPSCPSGFAYRTSNGDSTRESGSFQLRRRLRSGLSASALYTFSKSIDDDAELGGQGPISAGATTQSSAAAAIAQNWLDLRAERGRSTFDQRHLLSANFQYSTGTGLGGGTLLSGWRGRVYKEWTLAGQITAGSGLPETPVYLATTNGTGITGNLRPDRTTAPLYVGTAGRFLNPAAFTAPQPGQWGNAGRDSITGPGSFTFDASLSRTFRIFKTYNLDIRVNSTNLLNHAVFTGYNTTISPSVDNPVFGLPAATGPMRSLQTTARLRF